MSKGFGFGSCMVCDAPLLQVGGFAGSGMCGPCCTGEADTVGEITEEPNVKEVANG